jgi:hypothetical protein
LIAFYQELKNQRGIVNISDRDKLFQDLKNYQGLMRYALNQNTILEMKIFFEIRNNILFCDKIAESNIEKIILFGANHYWTKHKALILKHNSNLQLPEIVLKTKPFPKSNDHPETVALARIPETPPPKKVEWDPSPNDRRFLRSLRIKCDIE